jgi:hypothetical protein
MCTDIICPGKRELMGGRVNPKAGTMNFGVGIKTYSKRSEKM